MKQWLLAFGGCFLGLEERWVGVKPCCTAGVRAKVLDVDTAQRRLSLGLKQSYFTSEEHTVEGGAEASRFYCCIVSAERLDHVMP